MVGDSPPDRERTEVESDLNFMNRTRVSRVGRDTGERLLIIDGGS